MGANPDKEDAENEGGSTDLESSMSSDKPKSPEEFKEAFAPSGAEDDDRPADPS